MVRKAEQSGRVADAKRVPPLVAQIAEELSRDIMVGRYQPGERIREQELADRFGTSRAPVREAIRLLEIEGLIETEHWRGARVVNLSLAQVEDLFEMISAIFGLVARLAARHGSRGDFERFAEAVGSMQSLHDAGGSGEDRVRASFEAAGVLREASASPLAGEMLLKLSRLAFFHHKVVQSAGDAWQLQALAKWRDLLEAVRHRRDDQSEAIARSIVKQTEQFTLDRLREQAKKGLLSAVPGEASARPSALKVRAGKRQPVKQLARALTEQ
jgi:DNA-binding GntR family transcriptional regulator